MSPFTWLLWAILAIPVLLTLGAVIIVIVSGITQARHPGRASDLQRRAYQRDLTARLAQREAANKRTEAALAAMKRDLDTQSHPPRYGVRTGAQDPSRPLYDPRRPGDAPADLSWLDKKDGLT